jgi:hypothetical protein
MEVVNSSFFVDLSVDLDDKTSSKAKRKKPCNPSILVHRDKK